MAGEPVDIRVLRPEDLLVLDVTLRNLAPDADRRLHVVDPASPGRLVIGLPPQHLAEAAFQENETSSQPVAPLPVRSAAAAPSRLAFDVPAGGPADTAGIPLTVAGLLEWVSLQPALAPNALPPGTPTTADGVRPAEPAADVTALELVYRMVMSPVGDHAWAHRTEPHTSHDGFTEVWHTRLEAAGPAALRAIHVRPTNPFLTSLSVSDIEDLVLLTGDFGNAPRSNRDLGMAFVVWLLLTRRLSRGGEIVPPPATLRTEHVVLTPLGAHLHTLGRFDFPRDDQLPADLQRLGVAVPSVQSYEHITGLGRDQYVKVVKRGFLDCGHRATVVKITERRFEPLSLGTEPGPNGPVGVFGTRAVLRQYYRIIVTQPVLDYRTLASGYPHGRREMPLRTIEIRTLETPKIDLKDVKFDGEVTQETVDAALNEPFWITSDGKIVPFDFDSIDGEGRRVSLTKAMMFIPYVALGDTDMVLDRFHNGLNADPRAAVRAQRLSLTEAVPGKPDATTSPTEYLLFDLVPVTGRAGLPADYLPGWLPQAVTAGVHLEPVEQLTGSTGAVEASLSPTYLDHGFDAGGNPASLFATFAPVGFAVGAASGGGVAAPSVRLDALSATHGAVPAAMAGTVAAPALKALLAGMKLFGTVDLADLLAEVLPPVPTDPAAGTEADLDAALADPGRLIRQPVIRTRPVLGPDGVPTATLTRLVWKPALLGSPPLAPIFELDTAELLLDVRTVTRLDGSPPESTVAGELRGFSLLLAGVVRLSMGTLRFLAAPGRKPDVTAEGVGMEFVGALAFVDTVRRLLPADGFSDPPAISVTPEGIQAGFSVGIPTVGVGVFSLQNLSLSAGLSLPFVGKPAGLRFALSSREHPFLVTVTLFGGGGFFALGVSAAGVEEIEASIEFGGNISLNLGVASGGVYVMAGVYFTMSTTKGTELTGYFRCGGHLSVLGLISVSLEFYLAFTWHRKANGGDEIWGQASLTVSVKVLCFSTSVTLSIEKRIAGPAGDPTLEQVLSEDDWQSYCLAFAPEPTA